MGNNQQSQNKLVFLFGEQKDLFKRITDDLFTNLDLPDESRPVTNNDNISMQLKPPKPNSNSVQLTAQQRANCNFLLCCSPMKAKPLWQHYFNELTGYIFAIDLSKQSYLKDAEREFASLCDMLVTNEHQTEFCKPLLVIAISTSNAVDGEQEADAEQVHSLTEVHNVLLCKNNNFTRVHIVQDKLVDGVLWLLDNINE